jgi:internalin A
MSNIIKCSYCDRKYDNKRSHNYCGHQCWLRVNDTYFINDRYPNTDIKPSDDLLSLLIAGQDPLSVSVLKLNTHQYNLKNITSLEPLRALTNLQFLVLWSGEITSLEPLRGLTKLVRLDLSQNRITSLEPLRSLHNLTQLELGYNRITDLEPLRNLTKITRLCLGKNEINELGPISTLSNIDYCDLGDNEISNIEPLLHMDLLKWYYIDNCNVSKTDKRKVFNHVYRSRM